MKDCQHLAFETAARVTRLTEEDNGPVIGYALDLKVRCSDCGLPFEFIGVPQGCSPAKPMASFDMTELRTPIKPSTDPVEQAKVIIK